MAKLLLQRPLDSDVLGIHLSDSFTAVSARGDGVSLWSNDTLTAVGTYPIGSGSEELEARAVVCEHAGVLCAVLSDPKTKQQSLVTAPIATTSSSTAKPCALADASPHIPLPLGGKAHSLHVLRIPPPVHPRRKQAAAALPSCLAIVLKQGQVAWTLPSSDSLELHVLPTPATPSGHLKAAASNTNTLALLTQPTPGSEAHVQLFTWNATALTPSASISTRCPSASAAATNLSLAASYVLITWSDASVSVVPTNPSQTTSPAQLHLQPSDITGGDPEQPSSSRPETPASQRKKRRPGEDPEPNRPRGSLVTAFDDSQFLAAWTSSASETQGGSSKTALHFTLTDARFGCGVNSGSVLLELPFAPSARCTLTSGGGGGALALQVGGAVFSLRLEAPAASLLSLVGKLSLSSGAQGPAAAAAPGAVWSMDLKALAAQQQAGGGVAALAPAPAAALIEREAAIEGRRLQEQLEQHAAASTSGGAASAAHQQLQQRALHYALQAQQQPIRRLRCELLPTRLLTLLARDLAATAQWAGLQQLLVAVPLQGLQGCSGLLATVVKAQQYQLLAPLCCKLDEVQPGDVLEALASLLGATTEANLGPRRAYYQHLRAHAEGAVAHAEAQLARSFRSYERREALAFAQCAAAAVDQFSYREVLLHPLLAVPVDAPGMQSCLGKLDNTLVDRLLTYLAKWMEKYTQKLGEGAAAVPLPQELLFPTLAQVLEWVRLVLDAHLARLMMAKGEGRPQVGRLARSIKQQLAASQQLLPLLGTAQHIQQQAPLPAAHVAAATQYTVELLDLSIRM